LQRIRDRYQITIREAIADRGYGSAVIMPTLQAHGVETISRSGAAASATAST
jgi:hypothetical protein